MTAIFAVTFVMSAVLIYKWTLSHYVDDAAADDDKWTCSSKIHRKMHQSA